MFLLAELHLRNPTCGSNPPLSGVLPELTVLCLPGKGERIHHRPEERSQLLLQRGGGRLHRYQYRRRLRHRCQQQSPRPRELVLRGVLPSALRSLCRARG